ncbi:MAG: ferritin-like domain-containing protein [Burkholderiaceae bacterium]|nr:ferritin-like domain-containing protein [Burkholderiaceae bacterium]MCD8518180.1 ferritin-like domain-containing protein [Burkholderiaceae bacterium]MCD8564131.1 ferritin-like domain-containing protein [Burkholderiaceae bacterium]
MIYATTTEARTLAQQALLCADVSNKCQLTSALTDELGIDPHLILGEPAPLPLEPGRPDTPVLVAPGQLKHRSVQSEQGRAVLLHALAHIEFNAINLALDIVWRFPEMPEAFYRDWLRVAREEAYHFGLLRTRLRSLGYEYGDFPAHNGLWEMATKTAGDILARLALVPRTLEARGLDASPAIRYKLAQAGDHDSADALDIILRDEIGHVAIGNYWYRYVCDQRGLDPVATYDKLAKTYDAPRLRGPFNLEARRQAGFDDIELARLQQTT